MSNANVNTAPGLGVLVDNDGDWRYTTSALYDEVRLGLQLYLRALGLLPRDADDVIQEAFCRLLRERRSGNKIENLKAWIFRVAYNVAMDLHRANRRLTTEEINYSSPQGVADRRSNPEWLYLQREEVRRVRSAMSHLTPRQFRSVQLRANGFRYRDIAADLRVSEQRAIYLVKRAIERLGNNL